LFQSLAGARKRITLSVDQPFDFQGKFYVAFAIKPLSRAALVGLELRKLRLPEAQYIGFYFADARNIADFEIETVRDRR